jgi:uncharacterized protein (TIGR02453 family)
MDDQYFTPALFTFLSELAVNNDRTWFKANQQRFEAEVRQPALDFITDYGDQRLPKLSPHLVADSRTVGGSLFRIQRDTRFSKDKTPYKLNTGLHFRHEQAADAHAPGIYLHLEPGNCFMGAGLWMPTSKVAYAVRERIAAEPAAWRGAAWSKKLTEYYEFGGESLVRPPKGFDPDHPLMDDLKRKSFMVTSRLEQGDITAIDFMDRFHDRAMRTRPLLRFLCEAVGVPF